MTNKQINPLIVHQTISAATANSLRERIMRGDFEEGQPLLQDALAAEYDISRIPLREALRQLESEGLVTSIPHRGYMVAVFTLEEAIELCQLRALIECDVLAHAIPNMTEDHFGRARNVLDKLELLIAGKADYLNRSALNLEFHSILYEVSNRKGSLTLIESLNNIDRLARLKVIAAMGLEEVYHHHCQILKYCQQRNIDKAIESLRADILSVVGYLEKQMHSEQAAL